MMVARVVTVKVICVVLCKTGYARQLVIIIKLSRTLLLVVYAFIKWAPCPPVVYTLLYMLYILGVIFDSKLTVEKHLRLVSRAASQRLGILRKSWRVFHDRSLLEWCFRGFVLPVLQYCSAVWCSAPDKHLRLLDCAISGARFLTGGVFECRFTYAPPRCGTSQYRRTFILLSVSLWNGLADPCSMV